MILTGILLIGLVFTSCKNDKKQENNKTVTEDTSISSNTETEPTNRVFSIIPDSTKVNWVAYKTSEKVPVKGSFSKVVIENLHEGRNITETLDGLKFRIPISSVVTNDPDRDGKIKKSFFGTMRDTEYIKGSVVAKSMKNAYVNITMNGLTAKLPITYQNSGNIIKLKANMDLNTWRADAAIKALNLVCKNLHTGKDGISKTWDDVAIEVVGKLSIK